MEVNIDYIRLLKNNFSITNISRVRIVIEKIAKVYMPETPAPVPETAPENDPVPTEIVPDAEKTDTGVK